MPNGDTQFESVFTPPDMDIELLKREVGQRFPFFDMKYHMNTVAFFCRIDTDTLEEKFSSLRTVLSEKGYIPTVRHERGEYVIYVIKKPKTKKKPIWINVALLIATIFTTTLAGSTQWITIYNQNLTTLHEFLILLVSPSYLLDGFLFFSVPLLLILGIHEMGHYYTSKRHHLDTSLPFFIPLPPPFILGTFGAVISTREPIPDRKTLLDVGVSGPLFGFLVAIPVCIIGFILIQQDPIPLTPEEGSVTFSIVFPLIMQFLSAAFSIPENAAMHPTLFAGWVGIFLTAVNLLPIGQLDGGHVVRALLKDYQKYASWVVVIIIIGLGIFVYSGWLMYAFIILFLIGTRHQPPLNEISSLDTRRILIGILALIVFILCFAPIPFAVQSI